MRSKLTSWLAKRGVALPAGVESSRDSPTKPGGSPSPAHSFSHHHGGSLSSSAVTSTMNSKLRGAAADGGGGGGGGNGESRAEPPRSHKAGAGGSHRKRLPMEAAAAKGGEGRPDPHKSHKAGAGGGSSHRKFKLTPRHLYVAYGWYLNERESSGVGRNPGEEESYCLKCKDGGDILLCDFAGCGKAYHPKQACCGLKVIPDGIWECPRHRCVRCGSGPSQTDAQGAPREPDTEGAASLWRCRTCPTTYCDRCLPDDVQFAGTEIVCEACQQVMKGDVTTLQRELIAWDPERFHGQADNGELFSHL